MYIVQNLFHFIFSFQVDVHFILIISEFKNDEVNQRGKPIIPCLALILFYIVTITIFILLNYMYILILSIFIM